MKFKILGFLLLITLFASCDKYSREKYPQLVSRTVEYHYVNSCYSAEFDSLNKVPAEIHNKINAYLKNRVGEQDYKNLEFDNGFILSDKPIEIESTKSENNILALLGQDKKKTNCDTIMAFPIYSVVYQLKRPEVGIEKIGLNLVLDKNGKVVKDIDFPKAEFANKIIPIDSVHSELIRRKIPYKKLNIDLWFDKKSKTFIWVTNTLIHKGSIFGPSCFPEVNYHFKMNAMNGKITEYDSEKREEYFIK